MRIDQGTPVFRTLLKPSWIDRKLDRPLAVAFIRRVGINQKGEERDAKGLSVEFGIEPKECGGNLSKFAVAETNIDLIRSLQSSAGSLDVIPDSDSHGNLVGLPKPDQGDQALVEANRLGKALADSSKIVHYFV